MPIYEFQCGSCRHKFQKICRVGVDSKDLTCPTCGVPSPKRLFSTFAVSSGRPDNGGDYSHSEGSSSGCGSCGGGSCSTCGG
ncbi:MAG: zinc ribbon domain-containing protein [Armatimonadetes bacterium]|nr:zinc ribbon domain-containing protein [Armatimonadota bacterium]